MNKYDKWNEQLDKYFHEVSEEQLLKDGAEAGMKLVKIKKMKMEKRKKGAKQARILKIGLRRVVISKG